LGLVGEARVRNPVNKFPGALIEEVRFARDSPLEEAEFELPGPLAKRGGLSGGTGSAVEAKGSLKIVVYPARD
jgi:hypothetical protein